jgi:cytoskeletal protein RodZ
MKDLGTKDSNNSGTGATENTKKKKKHFRVRLRLIVVAMIIVLLLLLSWDGLKLGEGIGGLFEDENTQNESENLEQADKETSDLETTDPSKTNRSDATIVFTVIVREDAIFVLEDDVEQAVTLEELSEQLKLITSGTVEIQEDAAIQRIYDQVVKSVVDAKLDYIGTKTKQ